jgi:hypothetical protein
VPILFIISTSCGINLLEGSKFSKKSMVTGADLIIRAKIYIKFEYHLMFSLEIPKFTIKKNI